MTTQLCTFILDWPVKTSRQCQKSFNCTVNWTESKKSECSFTFTFLYMHWVYLTWYDCFQHLSKTRVAALPALLPKITCFCCGWVQFLLCFYIFFYTHCHTSPMISINNGNTFLALCPSIMRTHVQLFVGSVKQIICGWETDFQLHNFFGTVTKETILTVKS